MFSQREKRAPVPVVIALVEFDMQKKRLRFLLTRDAIRKRMQELERPGDDSPKPTRSAHDEAICSQMRNVGSETLGMR
jgi:hypothetical protein